MTATALRLLGFGPTNRPPRSWSTTLGLLAACAVLAQLGDALTTTLLLSDPARPYAMEANPVMASVIESIGFAGFIVIKLTAAAVLVGLVHYALRRGLPKTAYSLTIIWLLAGLLLTALNGSQLLIAPLPLDVLPPVEGLSI